MKWYFTPNSLHWSSACIIPYNSSSGHWLCGIKVVHSHQLSGIRLIELDRESYSNSFSHNRRVPSTTVCTDSINISKTFILDMSLNIYMQICISVFEKIQNNY